MGLFEPVAFASSATADLYADERGNTSTVYNGGKGCAFGETQLLPCDYEWPYQSIQYSLPFNNNNATTNFKKMAWGSTVFYGTGPSLPAVSDSPGTQETFNGFPDSGSLTYRICVVLGATTQAGLTKTAAAQPSQNCAAATVNVAPARRDFNGDGKTDILWRRTSSGQVYVWLLNGTSVIDAGSPGTVSSDWQIAGVGDFNGDGKADILWRHTSGQVAVWLLNGTSIIGGGSLGTVSSDWQIAGVGDFNGDGKSDILWRNSNSGTVTEWWLNGLSVIGGGTVGTATNDFQIAGVGDFNGDGKSDILWRNSPSGAVYVWLLNGTTIIDTGTPGSAPGDWQIAGVGDFNSDGKSDILWRNSGSGTVTEWWLNGLSVIGGGTVGTATSDFQIE